MQLHQTIVHLVLLYGVYYSGQLLELYPGFQRFSKTKRNPKKNDQDTSGKIKWYYKLEIKLKKIRAGWRNMLSAFSKIS